MAEYGQGVNYAKSIDPTSANIVDPGLLGGKVRVFQDYATISATSNLSSAYITVGSKLPTGSQVVKIIVSATSAVKASGTGSTLRIGDEGDTDRYITNTMMTSSSVHVGPNNAGGMYYTVTGTTDNYIRISNESTNAVLSSGTVKITVFYVVE
jgi:hypothetical protein